MDLGDHFTSDIKRMESSVVVPISGTTLPIQEEETHHPASAPAAPNSGDDRVAAGAGASAIDRALFTSANLVKLLPTATALAFQILSPSFTNYGACYPANKCLTWFLLALCSVSCVAFALTDSLVGADGRLYFGVATAGGLYVLNYEGEGGEEGRRRVLGDLRRFRLQRLDGVHAVLGLVVFLSVAFGDAGVQSCFFPGPSGNVRQLLVNLPLGAGVVAAVVFMLFPSSRKGIGYTH